MNIDDSISTSFTRPISGRSPLTTVVVIKHSADDHRSLVPYVACRNVIGLRLLMERDRLLK